MAQAMRREPMSADQADRLKVLQQSGATLLTLLNDLLDMLGKPTPGLPAIEYNWDEHRYRFSSEEHRELFRADPVHYAPQFAQFCAMALSRGEIVEANPEYWLVIDNNLYIFGKPTGPALFRQNLAENIAKANRNRALVADR